mmetsp:Transcript_8920/g.19149  ORF Transcript_8920/g.19149 Transcript_8920/m.19149 type:complete len:189 (+) Transcript_8920:263-829(+)
MSTAATSSTSTASFADTLKLYSPQKATYLWFIINAVCLFVSAALVVLVAHGPESRGDHFARQCYLIYNLGTSIVWCTEVALHLLGDGESDGGSGTGSNENESILVSRREKLAKYVELVLAAYFVLDSAYVVARWKMKLDHTSAMLGDLVVNVLVYAWATVVTWRLTKRDMDYYERIDSEARSKERTGV